MGDFLKIAIVVVVALILVTVVTKIVMGLVTGILMNLLPIAILGGAGYVVYRIATGRKSIGGGSRIIR